MNHEYMSQEWLNELIWNSSPNWRKEQLEKEREEAKIKNELEYKEEK